MKHRRIPNPLESVRNPLESVGIRCERVPAPNPSLFWQIPAGIRTNVGRFQPESVRNPLESVRNPFGIRWESVGIRLGCVC